MALLVAPVPVKFVMPRLGFALGGKKASTGKVIELQAHGASSEYVDQVEREGQKVVDTVAVGSDKGGVEGEVGKQGLGKGYAYYIAAAVDLGSGVAGIN